MNFDISKDYEQIEKGKTINNIPYKKYIYKDETITIYKNIVHVREYKFDEETNEVTFYSKHSGIIIGDKNPTPEKLNETLEFYIKYEEEYSKPINKVKRLVKKIRR